MIPQIAIVTAIYANYDTLKPVCPQVDAGIDWVCVTDNTRGLQKEPNGWRLVQQNQNPTMHPNRKAKRPKLFPWLFTDAPESIWIDASFRVNSPTFAADVMAQTTAGSPIAQFKHPWRDCVYAEAEVSLDIPKYAGEPIAAQSAEYQMQNFPAHWGLWATGVIARRHDNMNVHHMSNRWDHEINTWSFQDQVSQPVALRDAKLRPVELPGTHFGNPWITYEGSGNH